MNRAPGYSARVRELFALLPGGGALTSGPGRSVSAEAVAIERGAWARFEARIAAGRIEDCVFRAWGCPHTLAAAAWSAVSLRGRDLGEVRPIEALRLAEELEVPAEKTGRLLVVEDAVRSLLERSRALE